MSERWARGESSSSTNSRVLCAEVSACARFKISLCEVLGRRHLSTELKAFQRAIFINILPMTHLQSLDQKQLASHELKVKALESHLCKHTPYEWSQEKKSTNKTTNETGILSKLSIPQQLNTNYILPSTTETSTKSYILSCSEETWVHPTESASAQKVRNEQFCNHRSARSASNQAGIKLPIEIRESLTHASKCDQKSMQVEGKWCLPVCLICNKVIINCETMQTLDKKIVLPQKQSSALRKKNLSTTCKCMRS